LNHLSRVHERYRRQTDRRQTDGRATAYSEREREFTFAKNAKLSCIDALSIFAEVLTLCTRLEQQRIVTAVCEINLCSLFVVRYRN